VTGQEGIELCCWTVCCTWIHFCTAANIPYLQNV